ncbi:MAG: enoyl-CoA hydratase [Candidatus Parabeggiatoa sp. nov. 3]|nr:MAG: enoyl-CoA hydratase [Gammaproteobacteria bacterium]RKZ68391.1 MAG: enoyl-CoA hydratase [Gammaproteobacteria bacterium]RKZ86244.1 MAG: enoyl-CoA hydratase [Gammaproteobacteria bacterium]HEW98420.1 enoyl-CoA hydratase [Beggiatoa sp.]
MKYETINIKHSVGSLTITFNRLVQQNSINAVFLQELNEVLDQAEQDATCRLVILEGQQGVFCTGMDFTEIVQRESQKDIEADRFFTPSHYMETLKRLTLIPKVIISKVDGKVIAGGIGLVAASDLVIATPRSQFSLSEALWGLLPANVIPYLIRRVGYQPAYKMTLTTLPISAQEAYRIHLVDELTETPDDSIRKLKPRIIRLSDSTIGNMKQYFRKMWLITEQMEEMAISEFSKLISQPKVKDNIRNFVEYGQFPWENRKQ